MPNETPALQTDHAAVPEPTTENVAKLEPKELVDFRETVEWLADQSESDRSYWLPKKAEALHVVEKELRSTVARVLRERALQTAAKRLEEDRAAKQQAETQVGERRESDRVRKEKARAKKEADKSKAAAKKAAELKAEREKRKAELKAEREQREAKKEAERKAKEKRKSFNNLLKLPVDRHDGELAKLAKRLGEDLEALRQEFKDFAGVTDGFSMASDDDVEPWPEPVDVAALLQAIDAKIAKHVVQQSHQCAAVTLWSAMAWVHNKIATHSPILTATSAEADTGKTTLLGTVARLVPKPSLNVESTGPSVYRFVDAQKPTLIIDEADDLFTRKSDLKHIINASWTRGTKIPRQVKIDDVWTTVYFDPFCPKVLGLLGRNLPRTLKTRSIEIRMVPKRPDETVEPFDHVDDFEFATLRRQLARFEADNASTLKNAQPTYPAGMNNRVQANWKLLLAIAEMAGGPWPERAREAAERLSRSGRQPSDGVKLLAAMRDMSKQRKKKITSEAVVEELGKDPTDIWASYNHGGRITQRQVAALLAAFDIHPVNIHPTGRSDYSPKGYRFEHFIDPWARYLPADPLIRSQSTTAKQQAKTRLKTEKMIRKRAKRRKKR
jgi:flagellar biosynthesis GTPase FlhF